MENSERYAMHPIDVSMITGEQMEAMKSDAVLSADYENYKKTCGNFEIKLDVFEVWVKKELYRKFLLRRNDLYKNKKNKKLTK